MLESNNPIFYINLSIFTTNIYTDYYLNILYILLTYSIYLWGIVGSVHESVWQIQLFNSKLNIYKDSIKYKIKKFPTYFLKQNNRLFIFKKIL